MSWFSELTSKAEAMLVKLDKDAAQALQNPDGLSLGTKILDQVSSGVGAHQNGVTEHMSSTTTLIDEGEGHSLNDEEHAFYQEESTKLSRPDDPPISNNEGILESKQDPTDSKPNPTHQTSPAPISHLKEQLVAYSPLSTDSSRNLVSLSPSLNTNTTSSGRFRLKKGKTNSHLFSPNQPSDKRVKGANSSSNHLYSNSSFEDEREQQLIQTPAADDIRASINQSLKEYKMQSHSPSSRIEKESITVPKQTPYTSHFDNQPNLVQSQHSPLLDLNYAPKDSATVNRSQSSSSFSIDFPDNRLDDGSQSNLNDNITAMLLKQTVLRKKSTFYLHKAINRLGSSNNQVNGFFGGDKMKIRFRRAQLRAASYARRLNYFFRTYPQMKYLVIGYLFIMQLLVIYVLFFYQSSSSSSNDLSSQIKHQQQELLDPKIKSEIKPLVEQLHIINSKDHLV